MMTVRFPTGFSVQYNDANWIEWGAGGARSTLKTQKDGSVIAFVPSDCIVEWRRPCRTYNANVAPDDLVEELNRVIVDERSRDRLSTSALAELKRRLGAFNAKRRFWR